MKTQIGQTISERRAQSTGATITVERTGPGSWVEQTPGWMTICVDHSACILHPTRALAMSHAAEPEGWCEECRAIAP